MPQELFDLGQYPEPGIVPKLMHAQVIRDSRMGEPCSAFKHEIVPVPEIGPNDILVNIMASGVNYNNIWAALGIPINVIDMQRKKNEAEDFHIAGSDASGIVWKTGSNVKNVSIGDEVVISCGCWEENDPYVKAGKDPVFAPSFLIWGYQTNYGSLAQYARVKEHQCFPKPKHLTWEEAAVYMLSAATAYRMLLGWPGNTVRPGDPVLIWGGAGGLGSMAIQIARISGGRPIAVVSSEDKYEYCSQLGAEGVINRKNFNHWGTMPDWDNKKNYAKWLEGVKEFGREIWKTLGQKENPAIVIEHPGEETLPTSIYIVDTGGMVAICGGTTGYYASFDLRYHWMQQKRLQGTNYANQEECRMVNYLITNKIIHHCLTKVYSFEETARCHQSMYENTNMHGKTAILINALKRKEII